MTATFALITDVCFWKEDGGGQARISALVAYLNQHTNLVILYGGLRVADDDATLAARYGQLRVVYLAPNQPQSPVQYALLLQAYLLENPVAVCMLEYLALTFLLDYMPEGQAAMLDTHDLMSDRKQSYCHYHAPYGTIDVSEAEELALFNRYAYVLLIQANDYQKVRAALGEKALLVPHPAVFCQNTLRPVATRIGYVAGNSAPNLDAAVWFIRDIWPAVRRPGITLNVYGDVGQLLCRNKPSAQLATPLAHPTEVSSGNDHFFVSRSIDVDAQDGIVLHGFVADMSQVYSQIDIAINPVRFGAGLKIKNMEALGHGLPLLTTTHGASGLEPYADEALLVADTPADFAGQLNRLLASYPLRQSLGTAAYQLAQTRFSPEVCFSNLLAVIHTLSHS